MNAIDSVLWGALENDLLFAEAELPLPGPPPVPSFAQETVRPRSDRTLTKIEFQHQVGLDDFDVTAQVDRSERIVDSIAARVTATQRPVLLTRRVREELADLAIKYTDEMWGGE